MRNTKSALKTEGNTKEIRTWSVYQGPLGEVTCNDRYFFAWKSGCLIGASRKLEEAMEALVWREKLQIK
jgi:hypothetical protein